MNDTVRVRKLEDFEKEIASLSAQANDVVRELTAQKGEHSLRAHQAEWHIRGMVYHCKNVYGFYCAFTKAVSARAGTGASTLWMYTPDFQSMLFEFYALVNLTKIALDNIRDYLSPLFRTPYNQLPKSVSDFVRGETNCPTYIFLSQQPILGYLIDLRNCLVHYRSFAISDNAIVTEEGVEQPGLIESDPFFESMARASFRRVDENGISVNVYLPDVIFEKSPSGNKRLARFTYEERWNLLSMALRFCQLGSISLTESIRLLLQNKTPIYDYSKQKAKKK
jgi:hypothetical protein